MLCRMICVFSQVKLGEPEYKDRYYAEKFDVSNPLEIDQIKKDVVSPYPCTFCWQVFNLIFSEMVLDDKCLIYSPLCILRN